jgi:hypothetical protein
MKQISFVVYQNTHEQKDTSYIQVESHFARMRKLVVLKKMNILLVFLCGAFAFCYAGSYQSFYEPFASIGNWTIMNSGTSTLSDGHLNVTMALQSNSKYRADLHYNDAANASISFTLNPSVDVYLAIKFIGTRPTSGVLKMEMLSTAGTWFNTKWSAGVDGTITTTNNNTIYYFRLTKDATYTGTSIDFRKLNLIIADVTASPYSYVVDWVATFASVDDITANKDLQDDGNSDTDDTDVSTGIDYGTNKSKIYAVTSVSDIALFGVSEGALIKVYNQQGTVIAQLIAQNDIVKIPVAGNSLFFVTVMEQGKQTTLKVLK